MHSTRIGNNERGTPFEVRIIIRHPMETGYRTDESGKSIPRNAIQLLNCRYNGETVFSARMSPSGFLNACPSFKTIRAVGFEGSYCAGT